VDLVGDKSAKKGHSLDQFQTTPVKHTSVPHSVGLTARRRNRRLSVGALALVLVMVLGSLVIVYDPAAKISGQLGVTPAKTGIAPSLDGTGSAYCGTNSCTSVTASLTTTNAGDLILAFCVINSNSYTASISDSAGHAWTLRDNPSGASNVYEWYTTASSVLSSDGISCSTSADLNHNLIVFGVSGANLNAPFDGSASLPAFTSSSSGGTPSVRVPLSESPDLLLGLLSVSGLGCPTPSLGSGFSLVTTSGAPPCDEAEYEATSAAGSDTVNFGSTGSNGYFLIADAVSSEASPSLDGTGSAYCGTNSCTSVTASLTTTNAGDLILAFCVINSNSYTASISDSAGHAWTLRDNPSGASNVYEWYTTASSVLSSDGISCSTSADLNHNLIVFGVSGANLSAPFDPSGSLPGFESSSTGGTPSVSVSLSHSPDLVVGLLSVSGLGCPTPSLGSGFSLVTKSGAPPCDEAEYEATSAAGSDTVNFGSTGSNGYFLIADAIETPSNPFAPHISNVALNPQDVDGLTQLVNITWTQAGNPAPIDSFTWWPVNGNPLPVPELYGDSVNLNALTAGITYDFSISTYNIYGGAVYQGQFSTLAAPTNAYAGFVYELQPNQYLLDQDGGPLQSANVWPSALCGYETVPGSFSVGGPYNFSGTEASSSGYYQLGFPQTRSWIQEGPHYTAYTETQTLNADGVCVTTDNIGDGPYTHTDPNLLLYADYPGYWNETRWISSTLSATNDYQPFVNLAIDPTTLYGLPLGLEFVHTSYAQCGFGLYSSKTTTSVTQLASLFAGTGTSETNSAGSWGNGLTTWGANNGLNPIYPFSGIINESSGKIMSAYQVGGFNQNVNTVPYINSDWLSQPAPLPAAIPSGYHVEVLGHGHDSDASPYQFGMFSEGTYSSYTSLGLEFGLNVGSQYGLSTPVVDLSSTDTVTTSLNNTAYCNIYAPNTDPGGGYGYFYWFNEDTGVAAPVTHVWFEGYCGGTGESTCPGSPN
jgi:hypothetical protein